MSAFCQSTFEPSGVGGVILWLDAQLPPALAPWLQEKLSISAEAVRDLGLRDASDEEIFRAAKKAGAIVLTKDADFQHMLFQHGPPPQVLWVTCGNTSKAKLREVLAQTLPQALVLIRDGESLVEIGEG